MIYALLGTLMYAIANTLIRYVTTNFDLYKNMFFQYIMVSLYGFLLVLFFDKFRFDFLSHIWLFVIIGLSGFLGIRALMNAMKTLSNGVVFIIANLYIILGYFVNNYFFPNIESFSLSKIIFGLLFFVIICVLLFEKDEEEGLKINKNIYFPLLAALGWTIYTSMTNYVVKTGILSPFQGMFYCEFSITIIISLVYLGKSLVDKKIDLFINKKHLLMNFLIAFFIFLGALSYFMAYNYISGNLTNIICLFQIPVLSILSYIFLKDKMTRIQILTIIGAFITLLLFLIY